MCWSFGSWRVGIAPAQPPQLRDTPPPPSLLSEQICLHLTFCATSGIVLLWVWVLETTFLKHIFFKTGSCYAARGGLELVILLPQPLKC
jgi:hypothetical protein